MVDATRAVVIEGVPLVRAGIGAVLRELHVAVVAEAASAGDASSLVRGTSAHLLVVGENAGGRALADAIRRVKGRTPHVRIVALVPVRGSREELLAVLDAGADAIVPTDVERDQLVEALEAIERGERHMAPSLTAILFASLSPADAAPPSSQLLTAREQAIVRLVAEGRTNDEIAAQLFISAATVKTHLSNAYVKLGARNRYAAVVRATQLGIL